MPKITLKLQDLKTGQTSFHELESEEAAIAYLQERPRFTDVLGVVFEGLTREQNARLKAAMKPLDDEERDAEAQLKVAAMKAAEEAEARRMMDEEAANAAHRAALRTADPNRLMDIRYRYDTGVAHMDPGDAREIPAEAMAAIEAWIAERNEWVESRGQCVGEAKLQVWPGPLPRPGMDRIHSGSFVPVAAAPKKA
ncbi:MAG: hypothetical protein U0441_17290 [Polyangiaceae bacterium]